MDWELARTDSISFHFEQVYLSYEESEWTIFIRSACICAWFDANHSKTKIFLWKVCVILFDRPLVLMWNLTKSILLMLSSKNFMLWFQQAGKERNTYVCFVVFACGHKPAMNCHCVCARCKIGTGIIKASFKRFPL